MTRPRGGTGRSSRPRGAKHTLMLPPLEEALVHPPTWVRGLGPSYHGSEPVTLVMALEEEPVGSHASMIGAHLDILVGWTTMANGLLATSEPDASER